MNIRHKIKIAVVLALLSISGLNSSVSARENVKNSTHRDALKTTVTGCQPAIGTIDLDINNVRARLMTGGDMWWNQGLQTAAYEVPKGTGRHSQFAASCWIGGFDKQKQLKVAAQTYRQDGNDYWPGALDKNGKITSDDCANWDRFWKVDKSVINSFIELSKTGGITSGSQYDVIKEWPANGNQSNAKGAKGTPVTMDPNFTYAPFVDLNGDGYYEPNKGEYPKINGDEFIWWVTNDAGNAKMQSQTAAMGIEVQTSAFAYSTQDFLNNATFYNYRVINRGSLTIDSTYIALWDDCDLGYYHDDYIGCDTSRGLGIQYNAVNADGQEAGFPVNSYGLNPPQVGVDFFQGPFKKEHINGIDTFVRLGMTSFTYYNNDFSVIGNPRNGTEIYYYMTGSIRDGERFSNDFQGPGVPSKGYGLGPVASAIFTGDPGDKTTWSECTCGNTAGDRRFIFSSGPFELLPGALNDITFGAIWASNVGGCPKTDFKTIKNIDDAAQALFDAGFKTVEGPEAPRLVVRELDRKLIFYIINDFGSNNYAENYGRTDGVYKDSLKYHQIVTKANDISTDSVYHFEGYRVFQLANSSVSAADIFNPSTGEVDNTKAYEVFQCDIHNNITKIINYGKKTSVSDTTWVPSVKVNGKDSGLVHSFTLNQDQFATQDDKTLINYHNYYYVAIAYAYNNFKAFDPTNSNSTQDIPYLGSAHGAGGINIPVVVGMPNGSNGSVGTSLNCDYGSGVMITRVQGAGNGGNVLEIDSSSVSNILSGDSVGTATYMAGQGPLGVKVIDPVKVPAYDWAFTFIKPNVSSANFLTDSLRWVLYAINNGKVVDTIYSERDISGLNEQILEKYGLSITIGQVKAPGVDEVNGNGYITSSVTFDNPSAPWLWGVTDQADSNFANWIRSGHNLAFGQTLDPVTNPCSFNDYSLDTFQAYENMLTNFSPVKSTWAPYVLAAAYQNKHAGTGSQCGFEVAYSQVTQTAANFAKLPDVNIVFDADMNNWTRCAVIEEQEDTSLSEGNAVKFYLRNHAGWDKQIASDGQTPIYSESAADRGMSWFPGYAYDVSTGRRLNIVFGEDSYLASDNGRDMIWNPTSREFNPFDNSVVFGGKHIIYILNSKYDSCRTFATGVRNANPGNTILQGLYNPFSWVGVPLCNPSLNLTTLGQGLIPTKTTLRFRVNRPYAPLHATADTSAATIPYATPGKTSYPYYTFSTAKLAPTPLGDGTNKGALLSKIYAVPNPYYGYSGYEANRFDTKVKIINLPAVATVRIYSLDGTLVRTLTKSDPSVPYIDWNVRNTAGLPIASGMYIMHVVADGIGETVIKWFGAMRPIDATSY